MSKLTQKFKAWRETFPSLFSRSEKNLSADETPLVLFFVSKQVFYSIIFYGVSVSMYVTSLNVIIYYKDQTFSKIKQNHLQYENQYENR